MIPRTRAGTRRYQKSKVWAILITFGLGWIVLKSFPVDTERIVQTLISPPPAPGEAFRERESGIPVQARAVIESADPAEPGVWKARSLDGHPFRLVWEAAGPPPAAGDTLLVRGTYEWDPEGGRVAVSGAPAP